MADKAKKCECEIGAPGWMVTYGDLMSLLLTFFVLLLSFSSMSEDSILQDALMNFQGSIGVLPSNVSAIQTAPNAKRMKKPHRAVEDAAREIQRQLQIAGASDIKLDFDKRGDLRLTLPSTILFDSGSGILKPSAGPVLDELGSVLGELPIAFFEVKGFTDDRPVGAGQGFLDNRALSFARADGVARYLSQASRLPLEQFEAVACGEGQPVAPNTTEEGRAANRRVEIFVRGLVSEAAVDEYEAQTEGLTNAP